MSTKVRLGDRVRVVLEGGVSYVSPSGDFYVGSRRGTNVIVPKQPHVVSVEVLEPEWQYDDVVLSANGYHFKRKRSSYNPHRPWLNMNGNYHPEGYPLRPLTLLTRNGQKV